MDRQELRTTLLRENSQVAEGRLMTKLVTKRLLIRAKNSWVKVLANSQAMHNSRHPSTIQSMQTICRAALNINQSNQLGDSTHLTKHQSIRDTRLLHCSLNTIATTGKMMQNHCSQTESNTISYPRIQHHKASLKETTRWWAQRRHRVAQLQVEEPISLCFKLMIW